MPPPATSAEAPPDSATSGVATASLDAAGHGEDSPICCAVCLEVVPDGGAPLPCACTATYCGRCWDRSLATSFNTCGVARCPTCRCPVRADFDPASGRLVFSREEEHFRDLDAEAVQLAQLFDDAAPVTPRRRPAETAEPETAEASEGSVGPPSPPEAESPEAPPRRRGRPGGVDGDGGAAGSDSGSSGSAASAAEASAAAPEADREAPAQSRTPRRRPASGQIAPRAAARRSRPSGPPAAYSRALLRLVDQARPAQKRLLIQHGESNPGVRNAAQAASAALAGAALWEAALALVSTAGEGDAMEEGEAPKETADTAAASAARRLEELSAAASASGAAPPCVCGSRLSRVTYRERFVRCMRMQRIPAMSLRMPDFDALVDRLMGQSESCYFCDLCGETRATGGVWTCENGNNTIFHANAYDVCERCFALYCGGGASAET